MSFEATPRKTKTQPNRFKKKKRNENTPLMGCPFLQWLRVGGRGPATEPGEEPQIGYGKYRAVTGSLSITERESWSSIPPPPAATGN